MSSSWAPAGAVAAGGVSPAAREDDALVTRQGPVVSAAMGTVAVLSYGGALLLAHLLDARSFSDYAAAASLLGTVGVFASALIPLPLMHVISGYPRRSEERYRGMAFAWSIAAGAGVLAALVTGLVTATFAPPVIVAAVAGSALVLFACAPVWAWLHGELRFVRVAAMTFTEVTTRVLFSAGAVLLGWGAGGALIGFAVGVAVVLLMAPSAMRGDLAWRPQVLRERRRWTETGDVALTQLISSSLIGADVVLIAVLGVPAIESAGYQALSTLSKAPVFVAAGAVAVAFPLLRGPAPDVPGILTATLRSFSLLAFSSAAVVATVPREVMLLVFPERYADSLRLMPVLATAGVGFAAVTMFTTVLLALHAYRRAQGALLAAAGLLTAGTVFGWRIAEVPGLAVGVALGALTAAGVLWSTAGSLLPPGTLRRALLGLAAAGALTAVLAAARTLPAVWCVCVAIVAVVLLRELRSRGPAPTQEA
ncbi:lipopolysaccharide biosynthesis protein [Modestobacter sp. I12A-02662]|uniref:lipopolysaccharide biosynthesis protein n=1 Tax=Modestobacter sp. I12A-02662 TaxID=1730496 RepID=UPI0034DF0836